MRLLVFILLCELCLLSTGCGHTGPLYLPQFRQQKQHQKDEFLLPNQ